MLHFNILDAEQGSAVQTLLPYRLHHICALRIIKSGDILQTHIDQTVDFHISNQELAFHFSEISNQEYWLFISLKFKGKIVLHLLIIGILG